MELPGVGTLEAFNTDGLRTLLKNLNAPHMREKTLRYPGHAEKIRLLRELGFFSDEPVQAGGNSVKPLDVTAALLIKHWKLAPGEHELTVMRVEVEGADEDGHHLLHRADLLDRGDPATGALSMARTTGYPAVFAARMILDGDLRDRGILPCELLGADDALCDKLLDSLAEVGIEPQYEEMSCRETLNAEMLNAKPDGPNATAVGMLKTYLTAFIPPASNGSRSPRSSRRRWTITPSSRLMAGLNGGAYAGQGWIETLEPSFHPLCVVSVQYRLSPSSATHCGPITNAVCGVS